MTKDELRHINVLLLMDFHWHTRSIVEDADAVLLLPYNQYDLEDRKGACISSAD